jgi:hypothetical protein
MTKNIINGGRLDTDNQEILTNTTINLQKNKKV